MSGDDFQTRYATVMDSMLKSAIAETTKLFETMVDELKAEISRIKKENEDLKSKCNEFENAQNHLSTNITHSDRNPGLSNVSDKRDTAVQCDLVPLGAVLVEKCHQFRTWSMQSQEEQREHDKREEQQCETDGEEDSERAFILIKQEESDYDDSFPSNVFKMEDEETTLVPGDIPGSPGYFVNRVTPEGSPIHQPPSYGGLTILQKDEKSTVALETPCLAEESVLSCLVEAQGQGSEPEHPQVITPPAAKDDVGEQSGVDQQITETSTQTEAKTLEEQPLVAVQQQSAVELKETPSQISQQPQGESGTLVKEQFCLVLNAGVPSTNEQLSDAAPLTKVRASEELEVGLAETGASTQPNMSVRRRRGRPPKRTKVRNSQKQPVVENVLSPSIDIPTDQDVTPVQEIVSNPPRGVEKAEVRSLSVSTASSSIGCSSEKVKPKSQELPMVMGEEEIHSTSIQVPSAVEKVATPSSVSPRVPPGRHRERHASYPSLQDAMLLVEAMNAQTSAYHPTVENAELSPQIEVANKSQTEYTPPLVSLQTASVVPGKLTAPISPQTSAPPSAAQLSTTPPRASFSQPTVGQCTTAQSSDKFGSPNQQSTSVAPATIKAVVIPKQQYAVIPSKTAASSSPPSTVATQTSVQPLQQRSLHPLITVVAPNKQLSNSSPQKIIVVPRPMSSFTPHPITALSPTQLSTVVSTVVAAQKHSLPPASTAASLPLGASSLPSVPLKTIVVTSRQPMSPDTSQTTVTSADQQSVTLSHPKITIVVPRQGPAMVARQQQSTVAAQTVVATRKQQSAEPLLTVAVSTPQSVSLSQQSSVAVDVPTAPAESAVMSSQKWDNIRDDLESAKKTAPVSKMTTESTEICFNLKKSLSPGIVQTSVTPKVSPVFQEKLSAVVKLTKLPLTASTKEITPVWETSTYSTETLTSLNDHSLLGPEPNATQEKPSAVAQSAQLSPAVAKELIQFANTPTSSTENPPSLKAVPVALPPQTSAKESVAVQEKQLSAVKSSQSVSATSVRKVSPDSMRTTSSFEICSSLKESPVTRCVQLSIPSKVSVAMVERPLTTINVTQSTVEKALTSEATAVSTENSFSLKEVLISGHVQASVQPNEPLDQKEKPSAAPLRLTSIISKDTESDPHLQMTKTQFLAQLAVSPVFHVQQQALSSDPVDTSGADTETSTGNSIRFQKDSLVARLRSHLRTRLQASKAEPNPESLTEPEPTPDSSNIPRLAKDSVTDRKTNSESSKVSLKRPGLVKDVATPEKTTNNPTSVSPRRSRSSKDGTSSKKTVDEPTSVSPKRPRLLKDGASPKKNNIESTSLSPRWPRLTKDAVSSKKTTSERGPLSRRWPRLAKGGSGPKKARESIVAKKTRLIQDVTSPKKSIRVANGKKLAKAAKAKTLGKMENSSQSKLQNGGETRQLADANHSALKKAKAKAVWTPPRMSASKSPLTRGRSVPLSPAKRDTRSQNQAQAPTTPQRRSQSTSLRVVTPPNQLSSTPPNNSQTVKLESASKGRPSSPRTVIYPPSVSLHPIPVKAPPVVSPLQPLSVIGRRLLKNQCGECGRVLSSAAALESHVSLHTGRRPFSCTFCGKSFPDSKGLTRHGRVHRNGRIHICSQCGKGFVYRFGLTKHLQMVHGRVKPFVCQICNKGFFSKRDVEAHIRVHTGEKPFHCNLCDKRFKRRVELNVHLRWHNGEKRHWCPYCGKGFLDFNNLKRHKYIHTGEKPHSCPHCSKNFTQSGHLKKHVKNVHKIK